MVWGTARQLPLLLALLSASVSPALAQEIFHSSQSANLQTATTIPGGSWLFEISHRFVPPISTGADALWGLDGPVNNRLGLAFGVTDRALVGLQRSNLQDNLELYAKVRFLEFDSGDFGVAFAALSGVAWNTDVVPVDGARDNESQLHAQVIVNARIGDRVAIGLVPVFVRNPRLLDVGTDNAVALGAHAQVYLTRSLSLLGEWILSEERGGMEHDSGAIGFEIETRGHFFKLVLTNQSRMNPTQFLGGSAAPVAFDELRLGFNITRVLRF